jgi:clan AA aspartic protease
MRGHVDPSGRALLPVELQHPSQSSSQSVDAWIDTGFTGELYLPQAMIDQLQLPAQAKVRAELADGSHVDLTTYLCRIRWFGHWRTVDVVGHQGKYALVGIVLLIPRLLLIDYAGQTVQLT